MNFIYGLVLALSLGIAAAKGKGGQNKGNHNAAEEVNNNLHCGLTSNPITGSWRDMANQQQCFDEMSGQVKKELNAALTYLAMGAYFARDSVNRLGFSELFFKSASEEREHAIKIIEYLLMRGELTDTVSSLIKNRFDVPADQTWDGAVNALEKALELEADVTSSIKGIIKACEEPDDKTYNNYHLADYLTGVFLEEQYTGQREIAGRISTLGKMAATYGNMGEFLYDKKLIYGEL